VFTHFDQAFFARATLHEEIVIIASLDGLAPGANLAHHDTFLTLTYGSPAGGLIQTYSLRHDFVVPLHVTPT